MQDPTPYKPSVYYFRRELRATNHPEDLRRIGLHLCAELEQLKTWVREQDLVPPKWHLMQSEIDEKGWGGIVPFPKPD